MLAVVLGLLRPIGFDPRNGAGLAAL